MWTVAICALAAAVIGSIYLARRQGWKFRDAFFLAETFTYACVGVVVGVALSVAIGQYTGRIDVEVQRVALLPVYPESGPQSSPVFVVSAVDTETSQIKYVLKRADQGGQATFVSARHAKVVDDLPGISGTAFLRTVKIELNPGSFWSPFSMCNADCVSRDEIHVPKVDITPSTAQK